MHLREQYKKYYKARLENNLLTLSIQLSKSASLRSGGGLVTPESRVSVVGMNCNISTYHGLSKL